MTATSRAPAEAHAILRAMSDELAELVRLLRRYEQATEARAGGQAARSADLADLQSLDLAIQMAADLERLVGALSAGLEAGTALCPVSLAPGLRLERTLRAIGAQGPAPPPSAPLLELFEPAAPPLPAAAGPGD
ncbi:MAG: hypothetical protein MUE98_05595 [Rhodobacteraceae bacterium]|jgi:hypothetical protein|nr:hypothetical protein [Paracoccaceae bacterium]